MLDKVVEISSIESELRKRMRILLYTVLCKFTLIIMSRISNIKWDQLKNHFFLIEIE